MTLSFPSLFYRLRCEKSSFLFSGPICMRVPAQGAQIFGLDLLGGLFRLGYPATPDP